MSPFQQSDPQGPSTIQSMKSKANFMHLLVDSWAMIFIVILHRRFGTRYLDHRGFFGLVLLIFFPILWYGYDCTCLGWLFFLYLAMLFRARFEIGWREEREKQGLIEVIHSRYNGQSRLARFFPRIDEITLKGRTEPLAVLTCGLILFPIAPPLGSFIVVGAICMAASVQATLVYDHAKAKDAIDSMLDAHEHTDRVRAMWGDRG